MAITIDKNNESFPLFLDRSVTIVQTEMTAVTRKEVEALWRSKTVFSPSTVAKSSKWEDWLWYSVYRNGGISHHAYQMMEMLPFYWLHTLVWVKMVDLAYSRIGQDHLGCGRCLGTVEAETQFPTKLY